MIIDTNAEIYYRCCEGGDEIPMHRTVRPAMAYRAVFDEVNAQMVADDALDYSALSDGKRVLVAVDKFTERAVAFAVLEITGTSATVTVRTFVGVEPDLAYDVCGDAQSYLLQIDVTAATISLPQHSKSWTADPIPRLPLGVGRVLSFATT